MIPSNWIEPIHWPIGKGPANLPATKRQEVIAVEQKEPLSADISLLTALSLKPKHLEVQARCLDTWLNIGCRIVSQNTTDEIEQLKSLYPQVHEWIACNDVSTEYDYPTQRLYNLAATVSQLGSNAAIINSDIEILCSQKQLKQFVKVAPSEFVLGIRWNYDKTPASAKEFEWGLDLITISPEQLLHFPPDMPFAIGQPMWDYALPDLLIRAGFKAKIPHDRVLFHRDHPQHWNSNSHKFGKDWLVKFLGKPWDDVQFRRGLDPDYIYSSDQGKYLYNHWLPLHRYGPEHASDWDSCKASRWYFEEWLPRVPNIGCSCQSHWADLVKLHPPAFRSAREFFEWGFHRHNDVSREHSKKPQINLGQAYSIYWPENNQAKECY